MQNEKKVPVCSKCGKEMVSGEVAVRLNIYCIKQFDGWYCPSRLKISQ